MVRQFFIATTLLTLGVTAHAEDGMAFKTECMKQEIFVGEQVICSFVLSAPDEVVDVEVAKFPEFRGFWSENVALRQGPIPLMMGFGSEGRKGVVGSYILTPMMGRAEHTIVPMKLVVRRGYQERAEVMLQSETAALKIKPLPPIPNPDDKKLFKGAVGVFSVMNETREVLFQKDEPVLVRFSLQGEGNFQEINDLSLALPEKVELLSKRAYTQGSGQYYSKTFEFTLSVHTDSDFILPETPLFFFNPILQRYEKVVLPEIPFRFVPSAPVAAETEKEPLKLPPVQNEWTAFRPSHKSPWFWALQVMLVAMFTLIVSFKSRQDVVLRRRGTRAFQRRVKWDIAKQAKQVGNADTFLRISDELVRDVMKDRYRLPNGITNAQALEEVDARGDKDLSSLAKEIFKSHEAFAYSPEKIPPTNLDLIETELAKLLAYDFKKKKAA